MSEKEAGELHMDPSGLRGSHERRVTHSLGMGGGHPSTVEFYSQGDLEAKAPLMSEERLPDVRGLPGPGDLLHSC